MLIRLWKLTHIFIQCLRLQVEAFVKIIPKDVIRKGKKVTEDILNQLKWHEKGAAGK